MHRMDQRPVERPVDGLPQLVHVRAQRIAIRPLVGPQQRFELVAIHDGGGLFHQSPEQLHAGRVDLDAPTRPVHLQRGPVQRQVADRQQVVGIPVTALVEGPDARMQLLQGEWLDQVVIGSGVEPLEPVVERVPRRQHEDGRFDLGVGAQPLAEGEAVHPRDHQVQDDDVERIRQHQVHGGDAVVGEIQDIADLLEVRGDVAADVAVVLDDQRPDRRRIKRACHLPSPFYQA